MYHFNVLVVGAGAVGLACASELQKKYKNVLVLEKNNFIGSETSSRNSEVIHSGIYYEPNSLKAAFCVKGRKMLYDFCGKYRIKHNKCGKFIIASNEAQIEKLLKLYENGLKNNVENIEIMDSQKVERYEPNLKCIKAIYVKEAGVFDSHSYIQQLEKNFLDNGGTLVKNSEFISARKSKKKFYIKINSGGALEISSDILINCAGLHATKVAEKIEGLTDSNILQTIFSKGSYFSTNKKSPFKSLVYPLPDKHGLGIHLTVDIGGKVKFGPDHEFVDDIDYSLDDRKKKKFIKNIQKFWPSLSEEDLYADYVGIRPKVSLEGQNNQDFCIQTSKEHEINGLINLFGIESPGLTSSLAISEYISENVGQSL